MTLRTTRMLFLCLLLLFQPWRDDAELKANEETYADAFAKKQHELVEAMKYYDQFDVIREGMLRMEEQVKKYEEETGKENNRHSNSDNLPEDCVPIETENAMKDFKDIAEKKL